MPPPPRLAALAALLSAALMAQGVMIVYQATPALSDAAVFPDGRLVTVSTQNVTIHSTVPPYGFVSTFTPESTCIGGCVAVDPNGTAIAVCCTDGVRTYSTAGVPLRHYPAANPKAVAYHPTEDELAVVFANSLQLFTKSSATAKLATPVLGTTFLAVAYLPANPSLVLATTNDAILIVDRLAGAPATTVPTSAAQGTGLATDPAGNDRALVYLGNLTWSLLTASTGAVLTRGAFGTPGCAAIHPSGQQFTLINNGGTEAVFLNDGTERTALQHAFGAVPVRALYNPADWSMVILAFQQRLVLWVDPGAPQQPPSPAGPTPQPAPAPAPTPPSTPPPPANATGSPSGAPPPSGLSTPVVVAAVVGGASLVAVCGFGAWKMITKGVLCGGAALLRQQQAAAAAARHEALRREVEGVKSHISGEQRDSDEDEGPSFDSLEDISTQEPTSSAY